MSSSSDRRGGPDRRVTGDRRAAADRRTGVDRRTGIDRRRVLRGDAVGATSSAALLEVDLRPAGLGRLDPARIDEAVAQGRALGHAEGFEAGRAEALAEGRARTQVELADLRLQLERLVRAAQQELAAVVGRVDAEGATLAERSTELAMAIAEAVVERELSTGSGRAADAARRGLAHAPAGTGVVLRLHPDDAAVVDAGELDASRPVTVVADPTLEPGDCVAETGWTTVDARLGAAIGRVRAALGLAAEPGEEPA